MTELKKKHPNSLLKKIGLGLVGIAGVAFLGGMALAVEDTFVFVRLRRFEENLYEFSKEEYERLEVLAQKSNKLNERLFKIRKDFDGKNDSLANAPQRLRKSQKHDLEKLSAQETTTIEQLRRHGEDVAAFGTKIQPKLIEGVGRDEILRLGKMRLHSGVQAEFDTVFNSLRGTHSRTKLARMFRTERPSYFMQEYADGAEKNYFERMETDRSRRALLKKPRPVPSVNQAGGFELSEQPAWEGGGGSLVTQRVGRAPRGGKGATVLLDDVAAREPLLRAERPLATVREYTILHTKAEPLYDSIKEQKRFSNVKASEVQEFLRAENWRLTDVDGSHHWYQHPRDENWRVCVPVHAGESLPRGTCRAIFKTIGLL